MATFYDQLTDQHAAFIARQPMFFIATAPKAGRINLSPKGMDTFRVFSPTRVGYLDLTGSGNETAAHIRDDGRVTVMFNSFDHAPLILRLYGRGRVVAADTEEFAALAPQFPDLPGARQIIVVDVDSVQTSCGYAVPEMELKAERQTLRTFAERKGEDGLAAYRRERNARSIDGLDTGLFGDGAA